MRLLILFTISLGILCNNLFAQSNNPLSIYEGERINEIKFEYYNLPDNYNAALNLKTKVSSLFNMYPGEQYSSFSGSYYMAQIRLMPQVATAYLSIRPSAEYGVDLMVTTIFTTETTMKKPNNMFQDISLFPVVYNDERFFLTTKFTAAELAYGSNNSWFANPQAFTQGNALADNPIGKGANAWLEGIVSGGIYGTAKIIPKIDLNIYGGIDYLYSFTAGNDLYTNRSRIHGEPEEAFIGIVGGGETSKGGLYRYHVSYGRKQFTLGNGWLLISTSSNGGIRAASQLGPRRSSKGTVLAGFKWNRLYLNGFRLNINEPSTTSTGTIINGLNFEVGNIDRMVISAAVLHVPYSEFGYVMPDGTMYSRKGLQVYNLRMYRNARIGRGGLFFKAEGGFQRNSNFAMNAWAYYGELGWDFAKTKGSPSISYRYAYFSGDNPKSSSYNRWDGLYSGGNLEQWTQGSNMSAVLANSNEITHRLQFVYTPVDKTQLVAQAWLFYAPQLNNLGGNPALQNLKSKFYGSEFNLTFKYFHSNRWYFQLTTAYTIPGGAIRGAADYIKDWYSLSLLGRYSF